jgi:RND family efflux transporter MFP subunit
MQFTRKQAIGYGWMAVIAVLLLGLSACKNKTSAVAQDEQKAVAVVVEMVKTGPIEQAITLTGELRPQAYVELSPKISGRLQRLALDDGTAVKENVWVLKGQVVAVLEHQEMEAQLDRAEAAVQTAEAMVTQAKVDIEDKLRDKGRTEKQRDAAVTAYELAKAGVQSVEARLNESRAVLNQAQVSLDESFLKSPLTGVISKKFVDEGNMVSPAGPVVALLPMETLKFLINVPAQYLATMDPNKTQIHLSVDAYPDRMFAGRIEKIHPAVNPQTRTFTMELSVPNGKGADDTYLLRPGMYATARVILERRENAVIVPADSLVRLSGKHLAYVVENNVAKRRDVQIGLWSGSVIEVKTGLKAGEQLVVNGQHKLTDGTPVEIVKPAGQQEGIDPK